MKNLYKFLLVFLVSLTVIYSVVFVHTFFNFDRSFGWTFKSSENLNFHEKYSKKIHHIREESVLHWLWKEPKVEDLLFTKINDVETNKWIKERTSL